MSLVLTYGAYKLFTFPRSPEKNPTTPQKEVRVEPTPRPQADTQTIQSQIHSSTGSNISIRAQRKKDSGNEAPRVENNPPAVEERERERDPEENPVIPSIDSSYSIDQPSIMGVPYEADTPPAFITPFPQPGSGPAPYGGQPIDPTTGQPFNYVPPAQGVTN